MILALAAAAVLAPCEYEDSPNCYWDASSAGINDVGWSFTDIDGTAYYWAEHDLPADFNPTTWNPTAPVVTTPTPSPTPDVALPEPAPVPLYLVPATDDVTLEAQASAAWATWDRVDAANLLPMYDTTVSYVSGYDGRSLSAGEIMVWDSTGSYLFAY